MRASHHHYLPAGGKGLVFTDLQIQMPEGTYGRIAPRSGLAANYHITIGAGVLDNDYRGNVCVIMFNLSKEGYRICKGDRIAQLICENITYAQIEECESLEKTERGSSGIGSTGK